MWLECGESTVVWVWIVGYVVWGVGMWEKLGLVGRMWGIKLFL